MKEIDKVLFVGPNYLNHKGGIGAVLATYKENIPNFRFISTYDGNYSKGKNVLIFIKSIFELIFRIDKKKIEIIHIHGASRGSFYRKYFLFIISKYFLKKRIVYHLHGGKFHLFFEGGSALQKKMIRHLIESSDAVICLSKRWKDFLEKNFKDASVFIVNNPITFPKKQLFKSQNGSILTLVFLGKIGDNKGIFDLIKIIADNRDLYIERLKLLIGGDGEIERLNKAIELHNLESIVEYVGWVNGDLKNKLLSECDVLILPSYNEGLPISILEAMSYGKAIIATAVGGIPEIVRNNENGILIEPGNLVELKKSIEYSLEHHDALKLMGKKSFDIALNYDVNLVIKELDILYANLILR